MRCGVVERESDSVGVPDRVSESDVVAVSTLEALAVAVTSPTRLRECVSRSVSVVVADRVAVAVADRNAVSESDSEEREMAKVSLCVRLPIVSDSDSDERVTGKVPL